jgi:hypothetical protein
VTAADFAKAIQSETKRKREEDLEVEDVIHVKAEEL